ncbi:helix-turn-helix domain-containing protein [Clostridium carnis]
MKNLFSIGEVSKIKEITIKALRYYHKMGILIPSYIDEETGYRYYSIDQFIYIDIIKGCRALGTSIIELQEIFKERDTDKLLDFLKLKKSEAEENINKMREIIKNIDMLNRSVECSKDIVRNNEIDIKNFEQRYVIVVPCKEVGSLKELLYYSNLEKIIKEKNLQVSMERGIIYDINLDGNIEPKYVFNGIKGEHNLEDENNIKILPLGKYLTLSYSKENEEEHWEKVFSYLEENSLRAKRFIEVDLFNDFFNTNSYSCQIQVLIEEKY